MIFVSSFLARLALAGSALAMLASASSAQQAVTIRVGHGSAAEEQLWLMKAMPSITPGQGKIYNLEYTLFRGGDTRNQAWEAGQLDLGTNSGHAQLFDASHGMKFKVVASLSREDPNGFVTQYMVTDASPYHTIADLKGHIVGNNSARSSIELWSRIALEKSGLNPDRDVRWAIVPFPSQGEALRSGKLDVGAFPQPFAANEIKRGGLRTLYTSKDANPYDEELMGLMVTEDFIAKHPDVLRVFLADLVAATNFYLTKQHEAKQALLDAHLVNLPPDIFFSMQEYSRAADCRIDIDALRRMQEDLLKSGFQKDRIDPASYVDMSYLPK